MNTANLMKHALRIVWAVFSCTMAVTAHAATIDPGGSDLGGNSVTDFSAPGLASFEAIFGEDPSDLNTILVKFDLEPSDAPNLAFNAAFENHFAWDWAAVRLTLIGVPTFSYRGDIATAGQGVFFREYLLQDDTVHLAQFSPWEDTAVSYGDFAEMGFTNWEIDLHDLGPDDSFYLEVFVIPEPATFWLLTIGIAGIGCLHLRKRTHTDSVSKITA